MSAVFLLERLAAIGATVETDGETLRLKANKGEVSPDLLAEVRAQKPELIALLRSKQGHDAPQSFGQKQLWFLDRVQPGNPMYNNPLALRIDGVFDVAVLRTAISHIVSRHDILRTVFFDKEGMPFQRVLAHAQVDLLVIDLTHLSGTAQDAAVVTHIDDHAHAAFDLAYDLPLRATILRISETAHVLMINVHHIAADGWSVGIMMDEIMTAYHAFEKRTQPDLPVLEWQYADFANHQQARLSINEIERQTDYWKHNLSGAPELLQLPTDRPRPADQHFDGAHLAHDMQVGIRPKVAKLCQTCGVTPFAVFLAVHTVVMSRLSGQTDICTGTPFAGRFQRALEPMIGHFINTVVIRAAVTDNPSFAQLLTRINDTVLEAMDHQDIAFEKVVEAVNPRRSTSHAPLFQTMLIFQNTPDATHQPDQNTLQITALTTDSATAKYDITVELFETPDSYRLGFEYNTGLFDDGFIKTVAEAYETVLAKAIEDPHAYIDGFELCPPVILTGDSRDFHTPLTIPACLDRIAEQYPKRIAVQSSQAQLDYVTLSRRSTQAAHYLAGRGIGPGNCVALAITPDLDYVTWMLGVLKAGAAFVPVDTTGPVSRIVAMLADAGVALTVCDPNLRQLLVDANHGGPCLAEDNLADLLTLQPDVDLDLDLPDDAIAAVIFTSGSTGRPKGARVPHRGLVNLANWTTENFPPSPDGVVLQKSAVGFDASLWEFIWPLLSGQCLMIANTEARSDPTLLPACVMENGITTIQFVPATLQIFLESLSGQHCPTLHHIFCGGGILTDVLARAVTDLLPHVKLVNVYGVTESSVDSTFHVFDPTLCPAHSVPIGRPIANTTVTLLDSKQRPVPRGVIGEMYVTGAGVGAGYLDAISSQATAFGPHPTFIDTPCYRTGDLARITAQGVLEFHGRVDFQIKLDGFRMEPGDIETALVNAGCAAAVATVWQERLIAYVTGVDDTEPVRSVLKDVLPDHMIPVIIIPLPAFPLNASGKVDRTALPAPETLMQSNAVNQTTPRDATELDLYDIWQAILLHPGIGIRDNFFSIGGSSISAIKMLHLINQKFGVTLPLRSVIANPTIEDLGAVLRQDRPDSGDEEARITFRTGTGMSNVVCVHPAGGTAFCYLSLAKALDASLGVYGLQSPGLNPDEALSPCVETMAEYYLTLIENLSDAPLVITGLSFGGLVAHEMGRLLAKAGKTDISVVLLDTQGTHDTEQRRKIDTVDMPEFRDKLVRFNGTYPGIEDAQIERYFDVYNHNRLTVRDYDVPVSAARTAFVQARSDLPRFYLHEGRRYWKSRTTGAFSTKLVRGDHWDMLETQELDTVKKVIDAELLALSKAKHE